METKNKNQIKLVVVGDSTVGKTSVLLRYADDKFFDQYVPTVFDNRQIEKKINGKNCILDLWDTAGEEGYDRLRSVFYVGADVFLVCFSVISHESYENALSKWGPEVKYLQPHSKILLVGTKSDLKADRTVLNKLSRENKSPITTNEGKRLAKEIDALDYIECSSLTGEGVNSVFEAAILEINKPSSRGTNNCCIL